MKYNQNKKIMQITDQTLIVGIDIARDVHYARAIDLRGIEYGQALSFKNTSSGFKSLENWIKTNQSKSGMKEAILGVEPTGPYWLCLARYLVERDYQLVTVNPFHVKQIKEISDNSPTKNDKKDAKTIADVIKMGNYITPNLLDEEYEELRILTQTRTALVKDKSRLSNRIVNWLDRYFPEYKQVYEKWDGVCFTYILEKYLVPSEIAKLKPEEVFEELPVRIKRAMGRKKVKLLIETSKNSVGITTGLKAAKLSIKLLLEQHKLIKEHEEMLDKQIEETASTLTETEKLQQIKGIGKTISTGIIAELGDIRDYEDPKQLYKMAGINLMENSSGKKKGKTSITKRGRSGLRKCLYQAVFSMLSNNQEFRALYHYYRHRNINPLTGNQAIIALCRKLLRIIHAIVVKDIDYDSEKMLSDVKYPKEYIVLAA